MLTSWINGRWLSDEEEIAFWAPVHPYLRDNDAAGALTALASQCKAWGDPDVRGTIGLYRCEGGRKMLRQAWVTSPERRAAQEAGQPSAFLNWPPSREYL